MIELVRIKNIDILMEWRREVLESVFGISPDEALLKANKRFFIKHIADDTHIFYIALKNGKEAGCGAICLYDEMPSPDNISGHCGYIMNMYVRKEFRQEGIATQLLEMLISDAMGNDCGKIYLETTDMGRSVYADSGFRNMKDMMKYEG